MSLTHSALVYASVEVLLGSFLTERFWILYT